MPFQGFPAGKVRMVSIPEPFFTELLPQVDHLGELQVILYALWYVSRMEAPIRFISYQDFARDEVLMRALGDPHQLEDALERAVQRGVFLRVLPEGKSLKEALYFLNTPRGRAAIEAIQRGEWHPESEPYPTVTLVVERPNIYRLYEDNIGPLTPLIADLLEEAEKTYPQTWIEEAFQIAVERNVRNWKYIQAILKSWQEEGRDGENRRSSEENRRRYVEGKYADFIEH
ncbi:DnaD domain protein [Anaerolinea sp.]|uniref:DnaD domain-containing protein n=1 Tax=Anaerolinea sp. TaxID=1872519 RepID=UPI002ACEC933|nr:DnaD domain protein [Anaerolinea sp.]